MLIIFLSQTDVRDKGKEPAVPQHLHRDVGHSTVLCIDDIALSANPMQFVHKNIRKIRQEILDLATISPQTDEITKRVQLLLTTMENLQVSSNESFNHNKSSIMVYIFISFMSLTKICMCCFYKNL